MATKQTSKSKATKPATPPAVETGTGPKAEPEYIRIKTEWEADNDTARNMVCIHWTNAEGACERPATVYIQGTGYAWCERHETELEDERASHEAFFAGRAAVRIKREG